MLNEHLLNECMDDEFSSVLVLGASAPLSVFLLLSELTAGEQIIPLPPSLPHSQARPCRNDSVPCQPGIGIILRNLSALKPRLRARMESWEPTAKEMRSLDKLQALFKKPSNFVHFVSASFLNPGLSFPLDPRFLRSGSLCMHHSVLRVILCL